MALTDDIAALRDRALAELNAAHDYYMDSMIAWQVAVRATARGTGFTIRSEFTGTVTRPTDLAARAPGYVADQLTGATFQQFLSIFESFFFDFLRLWLVAYPRSLMARKVDFKDVLDAPDKDALTLLVVNKELNEILYERPAS